MNQLNPFMTNIPTCQWYALCAEPARGVVVHPALGLVPTCMGCRDKHELVLVPHVAICDAEKIEKLASGDGWEWRTPYPDVEIRRDRAQSHQDARDTVRSMIIVTPLT